MQEWEVDELFEQIKIRYENFGISKAKRLAWYDDGLKGLPLETALNNLRRHTVSKPFPPTLADLCQAPESKDFSTRYHEQMKEAARTHNANLDDWKKRAVGPTPEQRERLWKILGKRTQ